MIPQDGQDVFGYIQQCLANNNKSNDKDNSDKGIDAFSTMYRRIVGAANEFKEGDLTIGVAAADDATRARARQLLSNTTIRALQRDDDPTHPPLFRDEIYDLIKETTLPLPPPDEDDNGGGGGGSTITDQMTLGQLKTFVLEETEESIHLIAPSLRSDTIACLVKLMSNEELVRIGRKVFNPLPGNKIGSKGYLSARIQPNSLLEVRPNIDVTCYMVTRITGRSRICSKVVAITFLITQGDTPHRS